MASKALPLSTVLRYVPLAKSRGVSDVARGPGGFLEAYRRAGGQISRLPEYWQRKREAFIARHMAQLVSNDEPLFDDDGFPKRRHLALIMWAFSPSSKLR